MLSMLASVVLRSPLVRLLVIGDGPERVACEALARELGLEGHVRFLGQRSDVACLLAALDIVVMPSRSEGLSLAAIEALAAGKPIVGYAVGGLTELIRDGVNGRLVTAGDRGAFVDALVGVIENKQQRARYSERALRDSKQFSLETHVERLVGCYCRAAAGMSG
jgi:glycosyltransferase involved in cell wall biosynthesis